MISLFFWRCVWWMIDYVKLFRLIVIKFLVSSRASGLLDFAMPCGICCFHFVERVRFILLTSFSWDWKCKWRWDASDKEVCGSKYILEVTSLVHFWLFLAFHVIKMNFNIYYCFSRNVCLIIVFFGENLRLFLLVCFEAVPRWPLCYGSAMWVLCFSSRNHPMFIFHSVHFLWI